MKKSQSLMTLGVKYMVWAIEYIVIVESGGTWHS